MAVGNSASLFVPGEPAFPVRRALYQKIVHMWLIEASENTCERASCGVCAGVYRKTEVLLS